MGNGLLNRNPNIARKMTTLIDDFNNRDSASFPQGVMKSDLKLDDHYA
jgi:hypothetical protein